MRDLIVMVLVMGLVLSFVCADMGIAANQGANTHRYNGTNSITAHPASEISNTTTGTITATNIQAALVQIASQIGTAGALQTAAQTSITTIGSLVATNVQAALAEIVSGFASLSAENTFTRRVDISSSDPYALVINQQAGKTHALYVTNSSSSASGFITSHVSTSMPNGFAFVTSAFDTTSIAFRSAGRVQFANLESGTGTDLVIDGAGDVLLKSSSKQFKHDIRIMEDKSKKLSMLKPVNFKWNSNNHKDFGLIAEEVDKVYPELVNKDKNGKPTSVTYDKLSVILLQKIIKLEERIKELESKHKK